MINKVIKSLLKPKYNNYNIYVHNLSNFDGIFLLENLISFKNDKYKTSLTPIIKIIK